MIASSDTTVVLVHKAWADGAKRARGIDALACLGGGLGRAGSSGER
jgi:hypothetical protein